jgi:O-antigen/teichoic acid export membrane protein
MEAIKNTRLRTSGKRIVLLGLLSAGWITALFYESSEPSLPILGQIYGLDKAAHFAAFNILGLLFCALSLHLFPRPAIPLLSLPLVLTALIGGIEEGYQLFVPGRSPSLPDLLADIGGAIAAIFSANRLNGKRHQQTWKHTLSPAHLSETVGDKPEPIAQDLATKSISALKWNYIGRCTSLSLQFTIGIVLARLLGPEPFGVVAIALFIQGLGNLFAEGGLGSALIQRAELSDHDVRSVFSAQLLIGLFLTAVIVGTSPWLAEFFNKPSAATVIMAMALSFTLQAFGQTAGALMRRHLEFKKLQIIALLSYCIGYLGLGLPLALLGYGVWSLVAAQLTQVGINAFATFFSRRHPVLPLVNPKHCRLLRFGMAITLNNLTSWTIGNLDTAIVGRSFETAILGYYNRVFNLLNMPVHAITSSLQAVLLSAYSRAQSDRQLLQHVFVASVSLMALLFLPVYAAMSAASDLFILGLYGEGWKDAIPFMPPLCLALAVHAMLAMAGPVLTAIGRPRIELKAQLLALLFGVPVLILAAAHSAVMLAWAVLASYLIRYALLTWMTLKVLQARRRTLLAVCIAPLSIAGLLSAGVTAVRPLLTQSAFPPAVELGVTIAFCALAYPLLLLVFKNWIVRGSVKHLLQSQRRKIPARLRRLLGIGT